MKNLLLLTLLSALTLPAMAKAAEFNLESNRGSESTRCGGEMKVPGSTLSFTVFGTQDCSQKYLEVVWTNRTGDYTQKPQSLLNGVEVNAEDARAFKKALVAETQKLCDAVNGATSAPGYSFVSIVNNSTLTPADSKARYYGKTIKLDVVAQCFLMK